MRTINLISILVATILALQISTKTIKCGEISTVFVLETDSAPAPIVEQTNPSSQNRNATNTIKRSQQDDSNTKVITDDGSSSSLSEPTYQEQPARIQQHNKLPADPLVVIKRNPNNTSQQQSGNTQDSVRDKDASNRRLDDSSNVNNQRGGQRNQQQSRPKASQGSSNYDRESTSSTTTPKTEERLLISIVSDDDDSNSAKQISKPNGGIILPIGGLGGSGGQANDQLTQKRKPSITISIHDGMDKNNGGSGVSGTSAVIVRPSENGQSIVISTGGGSIDTGNSDKYNQNQNQGHHNKPYGNGNSNQPYKEPVNDHIGIQQPSSHNIYVSSTTYRPSLVNDYGQPSPSINQPVLDNHNSNNHNHNNRPITSTLIDTPSSPVNNPHRPISGNHEPSRPILSDERPPRLPLTSGSGSGNSGGSDFGQPIGGGSGSSNVYEPSQQSGVSHSRPTQRPSSQPYEESNGLNRPINGQTSNNYEPKYPLNDKDCGLIHETRIVGGEEADPNDFLWMAAIIRSKPTDGEARPFCGGSLITRRHILTAAHCLENLAPRDILVRLGSYDFDDATASSTSADYAIDQFRVPANYSKKTHVADIAIMRLKTPLAPTDNYKTVCMPQPRRSYVGDRATVTGYGSQKQTRIAAPKLRQVTVPIWENRKCSAVYKKELGDSFLCAGYEEGGKDACQGDSGGPLMTEGPNERMMVVGVVSHGIGCGSPGYPGVYTRVTTFHDWIEKNTREV